MGNNSNLTPLRVALVAIGIIFVVGVYPLTILWPSGWAWHTSGPSTYLQMILGIYATLGVFLLLAARSPLNNLSLIWFTVWSSVVHGAIQIEPLNSKRETHAYPFSRRISPEFCIVITLVKMQRAQGRPGGRCTRGSRAKN